MLAHRIPDTLPQNGPKTGGKPYTKRRRAEKAQYSPNGRYPPARVWPLPRSQRQLHSVPDPFLQVGWGWRGKNARLLRAGVFYANGLSNHLVLKDRNEQQFGFGSWHDF